MESTYESPVRTILCTIDFSKSTPHSLRWAISLARQMRAHLSVLYTYRLIQPRSNELVLRKKVLEEEARKKFQQLEEDILIPSGIPYTFKIEVGFVSDRIEEHARHNPLDFVVMDKTMNTANNESFDELMEHIHVPMLLVP